MLLMHRQNGLSIIGFLFSVMKLTTFKSAKKISTCASKHVQKYRSLDGALSAVCKYCSGYIVTTEHVGG